MIFKPKFYSGIWAMIILGVFSLIFLVMLIAYTTYQTSNYLSALLIFSSFFLVIALRLITTYKNNRIEIMGSNMNIRIKFFWWGSSNNNINLEKVDQIKYHIEYYIAVRSIRSYIKYYLEIKNKDNNDKKIKLADFWSSDEIKRVFGHIKQHFPHIKLLFKKEQSSILQTSTEEILYDEWVNRS